MSRLRAITRQLSLVLTPIALIAIVLVGFGPALTSASSHREAPLISSDPDADATDFYMYVSPTNPNNVVLIASYIPFSAPEGAPNFNAFSPNVRYDINLDTVGDAKAHVTYRFEFNPPTRVNNGGLTFLYNDGAVTSLDDANLKVRQTYKVTEIVTYGSNVETNVLANNLPVPPPNIGSKSTPNYLSLVNEALTAGTVGSGANQVKIFAGPRDDSFWVDLGSIFDVLSLRGQAPPPGPGYPGGPTVGVDSLSGFNVYSMALELPISRIFQGAPTGETVVGGWTASSRQALRTLNGVGGILSGAGAETHSGNYVQVSRLGMPLVNEAVIPAALKDAFNNLTPDQDVGIYTATAPAALKGVGDLLQTSVENPELGRLLCALYNVPLPKAPTTGTTAQKCNTPVNTDTPRSGRSDIFDIFLTGMKLARPFSIITTNASGGAVTTPLPAGYVVNQHTKGTNGSGAGIVPAEMLRLNTAVKGGLCSPTPSRLGVLGGDACGFPNGRRLYDDVVEIELLAVAGAAYNVLTPAPAAGTPAFTFNPALINVLTDSVDHNDNPFLSTFPYIGTPNQGQEHLHTNLYRQSLPVLAR